MASTNVQVFVATFPTEDRAAAALAAYREMDKDGTVEIVDAVAIVRGSDGKVSFVDTGDPTTKKWTARGAVAGGLVGLIFPPSILVSAAVGAAGGGIWAKVRDRGFDDDQLRRIGESLPLGGSAVVVIAGDRAIERLREGLEDGNVARLDLSADAAEAISGEIISPAERRTE
jgi:uncharacterized membrane protein